MLSHNIVSIISMNGNMDWESIAQLERVSKDTHIGVRDYWEVLVNKEFVKYEPVFNIYKNLGILTIPDDIVGRKALIKRIKNPEEKKRIISESLHKIDKIESYDHLLELLQIADIYDPNDAQVVLKTLVSKFGWIGRGQLKYKFNLISYVIDYAYDCIQKYMKYDWTNTHQLPALFSAKLSRAIIDKCEHLIDYRELTENPEAVVKKYTDIIDGIRKWMKFVSDDYKIDQNGYVIYKGVRGGKYKIIDGKKKYIR